MKNTKWHFSILKKYNSTSHNKLLSFLKNELINHPLPSIDKTKAKANLSDHINNSNRNKKNYNL